MPYEVRVSAVLDPINHVDNRIAPAFSDLQFGLIFSHGLAQEAAKMVHLDLVDKC